MNNNESMPSTMKKWTVALLLAACFGICALVYVSILGFSIATLTAWSFIFAAVASLLFAVALSLGSISYYIKWPNMRLGYQKQIGVLAFWVACCYCVTLCILYPEIYWYGLQKNLFTADVLLGVFAMLVFSSMVVANSFLLTPYLKWETIKFILGLGYIGYAALVMRAILIEWDVWLVWFTTLEGFPPGRLVLSVIAIFVLFMRISIPIHQILFKGKGV